MIVLLWVIILWIMVLPAKVVNVSSGSGSADKEESILWVTRTAQMRSTTIGEFLISRQREHTQINDTNTTYSLVRILRKYICITMVRLELIYGKRNGNMQVVNCIIRHINIVFDCVTTYLVHHTLCYYPL